LSERLPQRIKDQPWSCEPVETTDPSFQIVTSTNQTIPYDEYKKSDLKSYGKPKVFGNSCVDGQLTLLGMKQMEGLGQLLRERYVKKLRLLDEKFDPRQIWIRSTSTSRTLLTAREVMHGLYPPTTRAPTETIKVHVSAYPDENLYPRSKCDKFTKLKKSYRSDCSAQLKQNVETIVSKVDREDVLLFRDRKLLSIEGLANNLNSFVDHGFPLPKGLSEQDVEEIQKVSGAQYAATYGTDEINRVGIGRFLENLSENIKNVISQKPTKEQLPKMFIYSGHDNTLAPLLNSLQVYDGIHPRMGSAVIMELWKNTAKKDYFFQLFFYDPKHAMKQLKMPACSTQMCQINHFLDRTKKLIPENYSKECTISQNN